jgi:signal transduction histidine kinase
MDRELRGVAAPRLVLVFFAYGLAFFAMGLAIALEARRTTELRLAQSLKYLAAFGLLHGVVQWIDMWLLLPMPVASSAVTVLRVVRLSLFAISTLLLALFGTTLIGRLVPPYHWLNWIPLGIFLFWLANWGVAPHLNPLATAQWTPAAPSCLRCHDQGAPAAAGMPLAWGSSVTVADIWAHYLIYLPASLLAAAALVLQGRHFRGGGYPRIGRDCDWMALAFLGNALVAGLIVPPAPFAPASWLNYDRFLSVVGLPPQVFRAALAGVIAVFGVRILRVFDMEFARRLAEAREGQLRAQAQALEVARQAAQAAEAWTRELEGKVKERTEELFEQVRRLAILEERDRLAREMHDSLGQVLGFVNLKAKVAADLINRGQAAVAAEELEQMRTAVQEAYQEVRQAILSLRATAPGRGLVASLREYIQRLREQSGLDVRLEAGEDLRFPPAVEAQVIRIVQEALTNVRKHARASAVTVRFAPDPGDGTVVTVSDDGQGFDLASVEAGRGARFGLLTMRERAESIGGTLSIESAPGRGTTVRLWIPGGAQHGTDSRPDR